VEAAHAKGLVQPVGGYRFTLRDLAPAKGPYAWVGRDDQKQIPSVHWEYLIQVAEYARLSRALVPQGFLISVEDRLMDITVSTQDGSLIWYVEVKELALGLRRLAEAIRTHGRTGVDLREPDRAKDALRKAKTLVQHQPPYFSLVAVGLRMDFAVEYEPGNCFNLTEDMIPLG
jgi:hypothetical protein